jgi:PAS domain S-box-containing protein
MQQIQEPLKLEKELQESEEKFHLLTKLLPAAVFCTDKDGLITFYNEKAVELWGRKPRLHDPTELTFYGPWKMYDTAGDPLPPEECPMSKALGGKKSLRNYEIFIELPDGTRINVMVNIDLLYDNKGELTGTINVFQDITKDKSKHQDLYRLAAIIESADDAIISKNTKGIITSWNKGAQKIFGYTSEEIIGKHITILIPPSLREQETMILLKILKGETIKHFDTVRLTRQGKEINISLRVSPIRNDDGEIIGVSKIARDITDRVELFNRLKFYAEEVYKLAAIVESSDDAIISKTLNGTITSWNKGAEKIFGYTKDEIIGKPISTLIPPYLREQESLIIEKIRNDEKVEHYETIRQTRDGRLINISLTVSPVRNEKGEITGASKIARDITERVTLDKQLKLYNEKLKEMNTYKDEFMAMASHELKTPLTVIKANLQLLDMKRNVGSDSEVVTKIMKQVNKLSDLMSDLLDISKIQAGSLQMDFTDFDIIILLNETIANIQQTTNSHKIIINHHEDELFVTADRRRLEQVIVNILINAIKYSPRANKVIVDVKKENDHVVVNIKDFGIGIPDRDITKIFSRFYRVRGIASTFSGSGIGLYISNEIIKRLDGKMWVKSKENEGSDFYFTIPCRT